MKTVVRTFSNLVWSNSYFSRYLIAIITEPCSPSQPHACTLSGLQWALLSCVPGWDLHLRQVENDSSYLSDLSTKILQETQKAQSKSNESTNEKNTRKNMLCANCHLNQLVLLAMWFANNRQNRFRELESSFISMVQILHPSPPERGDQLSLRLDQRHTEAASSCFQRGFQPSRATTCTTWNMFVFNGSQRLIIELVEQVTVATAVTVVALVLVVVLIMVVVAPTTHPTILQHSARTLWTTHTGDTSGNTWLRPPKPHPHT